MHILRTSIVHASYRVDSTGGGTGNTKSDGQIPHSASLRGAAQAKRRGPDHMQRKAASWAWWAFGNFITGQPLSRLHHSRKDMAGLHDSPRRLDRH